MFNLKFVFYQNHNINDGQGKGKRTVIGDFGSLSIYSAGPKVLLNQRSTFCSVIIVFWKNTHEIILLHKIHLNFIDNSLLRGKVILNLIKYIQMTYFCFYSISCGLCQEVLVYNRLFIDSVFILFLIFVFMRFIEKIGVQCLCCYKVNNGVTTKLETIGIFFSPPFSFEIW